MAFSDLPQHGGDLAAIAGRFQFQVIVAADEHGTDPLVGGETGPGQQSRGPGGGYRLQRLAGAEEQTVALIQDDMDGALPFLTVELGVGAPGPGGDPPVDAADIIAVLVGPDFIEIHAATAKAGAVLAVEMARRQPGLTGQQLAGLPTQTDELGKAQMDTVAASGYARRRCLSRAAPEHYGTGTRSSRRRITASVSTPSASAS